MPRYDYSCTNPEGAHTFEHYLPLDRYKECPPCPDCGAATERLYLPAGTNNSPVDPVVVYRAPDGSYRFPGDINGAGAKKYEQMGYTREEFRGAADVRRLEKKISKADREQIEKRVERHQQVREAQTKQRRSDFYHRMQSMSNLGRDVAREAIARNDRKPGPRTYDSNFHVEVYSHDRSNRD